MSHPCLLGFQGSCCHHQSWSLLRQTWRHQSDSPRADIHRSLHTWGEGSLNPGNGVRWGGECLFPTCTRGTRSSSAGPSGKWHIGKPGAGRAWHPGARQWARILPPTVNVGLCFPSTVRTYGEEGKQVLMAIFICVRTHTLRGAKFLPKPQLSLWRQSPFILGPQGHVFWTIYFIQNSLVIRNDLHFTSVKYLKHISFSAKESHLLKYRKKSALPVAGKK